MCGCMVGLGGGGDVLFISSDKPQNGVVWKGSAVVVVVMQGCVCVCLFEGHY